MKVRYIGKFEKVIPNIGVVYPGNTYTVPSDFKHPEFVKVEKEKKVKNSKK